MTAIYLEPAMVPASLRGGYQGKKFKAIVCLEMTIPSDVGLWDGGSRDHYSLIKFETGEQYAVPGQANAPWIGARVNIPVKLEPNFAVVRHTVFCGKDLGLTFYIHPDNAAKLLPTPAAELSEHEKIVLSATCSYKSSYGGKDRYTIAMDNACPCWEPDYEARKAAFPTRTEWSAAKDSLRAKGFLTAAGAITPAGRNARPPCY